VKISDSGFHKAFDSRIRLVLVSILAVNDRIDFNSLKEYLEITDGNLASHLKALEKEEFITVEKSFIGKKPNTKYSLTAEGKEAFANHLKALERIIESQKN
jgi:DNA-binding MarR family transcriptional regulator